MKLADEHALKYKRINISLEQKIDRGLALPRIHNLGTKFVSGFIEAG
jgi:hypothetical protein